MCTLFLGSLNYFGYSVLGTASKDNAEYFEQEDLMSAFFSASVIFGFVAQLINSKYMVKVPHMHKILFIGISWLFAYFIYLLAFQVPKDIGFALALLGTSLQGALNTVAINTVIGYLKSFPADSVAGFSTGAGISGISASLFYLVASNYLSFSWILILLVPTSFVYVFSFYWLLKIHNSIKKKISEFEKIHNFNHQEVEEVDP